MLKRTSLVRVLWAIAFLLFLLAMLGSPSFQECAAHSAHTGQNEQDSHSSLFAFINFFLHWSYLDCAGHFIHAAHEEILAAFTILLALFTLALWSATAALADDAKESGIAQAERMEKSINEAANAAKAMDELAKATKRNTDLLEPMLQKQMRAYLTVESEGPTYQTAYLRFAGALAISNSGLTPARNISYWVNCDVLPVPLPTDFSFPRPEIVIQTDLGISPRQQLNFNTLMSRRIPDEDILDTLSGESRRFYVWGEVAYDDISGAARRITKFCHSFFWALAPAQDKEGLFFKPTSSYNNAHNCSD